MRKIGQSCLWRCVEQWHELVMEWGKSDESQMMGNKGPETHSQTKDESK